MTVDVVVIGGGISGLTTGWALGRQGHNIVVLERQVRVGGNAQSSRFSGFLMEHGPSSVTAASPAVGEVSGRLGDHPPTLRPERIAEPTAGVGTDRNGELQPSRIGECQGVLYEAAMKRGGPVEAKLGGEAGLDEAWTGSLGQDDDFAGHARASR